MPSKTFFNLPIEKQETLLLAARREFQRVPLYDASINRIILDAKIPRGSFYMYFKDKEDLYFYTLSNLIEFLFEKSIDYLKQYEGDILKAYLVFFDELLDYSTLEENKRFFQNILLSFTPESREKLMQDERPFNDKIAETLSNINLDKLNLSKQDALDLLDVLTSVVMFNIMKVFRGTLTKEESRERIQFMIRALGYGLYQRKEN